MKRQAQKNFDTFSVQSNIYNEQAGGQKNLSVGPKLEPIKIDATTYTTDASTARNVGFGKQLAIYNNSGSLASATLGSTSAVASVVAGVVTPEYEVGIALKPNDWTYISTGDMNWVITSAATALVYVVEDYTQLVKE